MTKSQADAFMQAIQYLKGNDNEQTTVQDLIEKNG